MDAGRDAHRERRVRGGIKGSAEVRAAAVLTVLGLDGFRVLESADPVEALTMQAIGDEAARFVQMRDKALAAEIANAVARLFKRS